jgi:hypothetical protein
MRSGPRCYKQDNLGRGLSHCELWLLEAGISGDSSIAQRKGNVRFWKPIPSNDSEDVTVK